MSTDTKRKVLLIDDEKFLLEIYSIKFHKRGFDVFVCNSADEGVKALQNGYEPDVILFDITMPYKSGYEFLEELKYLHLGKHSLKVALTNESQAAEMDRTKELGADAHLVKAKYTAGEVVDEVTALLQKHGK
jgi:CheY-like chemotaxis protein